MARKGKKKGTPAAPEPKEKAFEHRPFAVLTPPKNAKGSGAALPHHNQRPAPSPSPAASPSPPTPPPAAPVADGDLFRQAVDSLDQADIFGEKFSERDLPRPPRNKANAANTLDPLEREIAVFTEIMAGDHIRRLPPAKARRVPLQLQPQLQPTPAPRTPALSDLKERNPRGLLEAAEKAEREATLPSTSLRGLTREPAMIRLTAFLQQQHRAGVRLVRIVTGKGHGSEAEPVLKGLTATHLDADPLVAAFAADIDRDGDFGSYIVRLKRS